MAITFPAMPVVMTEGAELFRVDEGDVVWLEDIGAPNFGFRIHLNPKPEEILPHWYQPEK